MTIASEKTLQNRQIGMLICSLALVIAAMLWTWHLGISANDLDHRLEHATDEVTELRQLVQQLEMKRS